MAIPNPTRGPIPYTVGTHYLPEMSKLLISKIMLLRTSPEGQWTGVTLL